MKRFIADVKQYMYYCVYSAKTDLKAEVANSYLNWIWWVLEPLCSMLVYYFVFSNILKNTTEYFLLFIYSAILMWNFFNRIITYSIKLVRTNKEIVSKVYVPKYILLISNMFLNGIKLAISLLILIIMMILYKVPLTLNTLYIIPSYIIIILFTFGCGTILLHFGVFVDDLSYAVTILLNFLMFVSGIFYDVETAIPAPLNEILLKYNPIAMLISCMRNALLYNQAPDVILLVTWGCISIFLCIIGVKVIYKYENSYVKVV